MPDKHKNGNVSDADLDALLAEWAEAEIEPPAGFHEQAMKRLRAEAQPMKKNNVISLFAKNRRWTSIAAAAVLMLFCVPVVQGQLGGDITSRAADTTVQMAQEHNYSQTEAGEDAKEPDSQDGYAADAKNKAADKTENKAANRAKNEANNEALPENPDKKAVMNAVIMPETVQNTGEADIAAEPAAAEDNQPMIAAFSLEEDTAAGTGKARMAAEQPAAYSYVSDEESLEVLEQKLADLEAMLLDYQTQLAANPEDTELQKLVAEQQNAIDELKAKIEEMKQQAE